MRRTNRQRAAALLAARIEHALSDPVTAQEVRDALGEPTDFAAQTVEAVADAASRMALHVLSGLDKVNQADRYPEPQLTPERLPEVTA